MAKFVDSSYRAGLGAAAAALFAAGSMLALPQAAQAADEYPVAQTALLVIDPCNDFLAENGKLWPLVRGTVEETGTIENLERLVSASREAGIQIVYVLHRKNVSTDFDGWRFLNPTHRGQKDFEVFKQGSFGAEIHPAATPQEGDLVAYEHWTASGFANTNLDLLLRQHGIDRVVIAGVRANTCVDTTGRYAVELGYHATLISDAIAAFSWDEMKATIETNWPAFGHAVHTTDEFLTAIGGEGVL